MCDVIQSHIWFQYVKFVWIFQGHFCHHFCFLCEKCCILWPKCVTLQARTHISLFVNEAHPLPYFLCLVLRRLSTRLIFAIPLVIMCICNSSSARCDEVWYLLAQACCLEGGLLNLLQQENVCHCLCTSQQSICWCVLLLAVSTNIFKVNFVRFLGLMFCKIFCFLQQLLWY
jgi:hypothetical protein